MATTQNSQPSTIPQTALWLGATGAIPFVCLAVASVLIDPGGLGRVEFALIAYGAVILSFLGGVQWGLAVSGDRQRLTARLTMSIFPSLIGWAALLAPPALGLAGLAAAFGLVLYWDWQADKRDEAPDWYLRLRMPLTAVVFVSLVVGLLGRLF